MQADVSVFYLHNMIDACAIWNLLSSRLFYSRAHIAGCTFYCTSFVQYECLRKPRQNPKTTEEIELQDRLVDAQRKGDFQVFDLDIADLQDVSILENRKKLGKGELSSIVLASKMNQGFLADDDGAVKFAKRTLPPQLVQTTPHLLGWLYFTNQLGESEKDQMITEHKSMHRNLHVRYEAYYQEALRCRLIVQTSSGNVS